MNEDTIIEMVVVQRDEDDEITTNSLPMRFTLGQLRDWMIEELDGVFTPVA